MAFQVLASEARRSYATYHPTLWKDLSFTYSDSKQKNDNSPSQAEFEALKDEVRRMLSDGRPNLVFIDAVQRIGVAYHFEDEIKHVLDHYSVTTDDDNDLYSVALQFRLLRQHGIKVSCDIFQRFKDGEGKFKELLNGDVLGMLSLYEAAHLGIRGEDILDEAIDFTTTNLNLILPKLSPNLAKQVTRALTRPIRKWLPRLEARHYIDIYQSQDSYNSTLFKFAKLDFNIIQRLHQQELNGIIEWWKKWDMPTKVPYGRDRVVECYFWIMGIYFEPEYSFGRIMISKLLSAISQLDDTYDNYGTYEELKVLSEAIYRWDVKITDTLPECMKTVFCMLENVYNEIEETITKEGRSYCMDYLKGELNRVVQSYLTEAKWRDHNYVPTFEEYMRISKITTCYPLLSTTSLIGMAEIANQHLFEWIYNYPKIVQASATICRLMDDIVSGEFEQKRDHVSSGIECYIKENGSSEEEVIKLFKKETANAWKDINEECLNPTPPPKPILEAVLNLARVMDLLYKEIDGYTNSHIIKDHVASVLRDPLV